MKASIEWLKEYTNIQKEPKELAEILTITGSKVETIESKGNDIKNVVVGKILEINKHPNADKLIITKVNIGSEIVQIVTGADNVKVGDLIPIAKDGSELPGGVKIKKGMLRGVESCGMMCSIGELGLKIDDYPNQIEHGIMILPSSNEKDIGKNIVEVLNLKEDIIEFEITPNRPDCFSIEGLGRETAVSLGETYKNPRKNIDEQKEKVVDNIHGLKVDIMAPDLCYRYTARAVENVKIEPSPEWMQRRLRACGMRAINNIVDITNYVMLEMGQPMHAFDIDSISGKHIIVRRAKDGEKITTLDNQERILHKNNLVIADEIKAVAVAGVMGGLNSEIENSTHTVVFESAVFYGGSVRITAKELGLRTEASSRYEKGLSSENALRAVNRAVKLDIKIENGYAISPYYRMDLEQEADLAEEVLRIYGYDKLGSTLINAETTLGRKNKKQKLEDKLKSLLVNKGYSEIYTYGFLNEKELEKSAITKDEEPMKQLIKIKNPLSEDYTVMRLSTIPSMMQALSTNYFKKNMRSKTI